MAYIVVATANAHKVEEYRRLLADQKVELKSLLDYPGFPGVEETGTSFRENAAIKALAACRYCDVPAFADDSGLEVEALDGRPGIYSSRYAATDSERIAKLLGELKGVENRRARFVCAIAIAVNGEVILDGNIREACQGHAVAPDGGAENPYMIDHRNHPGLFNKKGHIAFCGHGAGIQFRRVRILDLSSGAEGE